MGTINITKNEFLGFVINELNGYYNEKVSTQNNVVDPDEFNGSSGEYVYVRTLENKYYGFQIRIYSTVDYKTETSRRSGSDAIRVQLYDDYAGNIVETPRRDHIKRKPNYKEKIKEDINELILCDKCQNKEYKVANKESFYMWCDNCGKTRSIDYSRDY